MLGESGQALQGDTDLLEQPTGVYRRRFSSSAKGNDRVSCSGTCGPAATGLFPPKQWLVALYHLEFCEPLGVG
jgi:hypothetical protein